MHAPFTVLPSDSPSFPSVSLLFAHAQWDNVQPQHCEHTQSPPLPTPPSAPPPAALLKATFLFPLAVPLDGCSCTKHSDGQITHKKSYFWFKCIILSLKIKCPTALWGKHPNPTARPAWVLPWGHLQECQFLPLSPLCHTEPSPAGSLPSRVGLTPLQVNGVEKLQHTGAVPQN